MCKLIFFGEIFKKYLQILETWYNNNCKGESQKIFEN